MVSHQPPTSKRAKKAINTQIGTSPRESNKRAASLSLDAPVGKRQHTELPTPVTTSKANALGTHRTDTSVQPPISKFLEPRPVADELVLRDHITIEYPKWTNSRLTDHWDGHVTNPIGWNRRSDVEASETVFQGTIEEVESSDMEIEDSEDSSPEDIREYQLESEESEVKSDSDSESHQVGDSERDDTDEYQPTNSSDPEDSESELDHEVKINHHDDKNSNTESDLNTNKNEKSPYDNPSTYHQDQNDTTEFICCVCGAIETDPDEDAKGEQWISCTQCTVWQHKVCMGVSTDYDEEPEDYLCEICGPQFHEDIVDALEKVAGICRRRRKAHDERLKCLEREEGRRLSAELSLQ